MLYVLIVKNIILYKKLRERRKQWGKQKTSNRPKPDFHVADSDKPIKAVSRKANAYGFQS